jgi:hypothetical protein
MARHAVGTEALLAAQSGRVRADDRPSNSVDADSAASGSASQAQARGYTFGRLLSKPALPLQLSRQRTQSDEAESPISAWHPSGKACYASLKTGPTVMRLKQI